MNNQTAVTLHLCVNLQALQKSCTEQLLRALVVPVAEGVSETIQRPCLPAAAVQLGGEAEEEVGWHPARRTSGAELMRQGSHSSFLSASRLDKPSQSGLLEQLMSYDNGLQAGL